MARDRDDDLRRLENDGVVRRIKANGAFLYAVTDLGAAARPAIEELGFWGLRLQRVGPVEHARSVRAIAMAVQAILSRAREALPERQFVVELEVEGQLIEVLLGPAPTAIARLSAEPDAQIRVPRSLMSAMIVGQPFDDSALHLVAGDASLLPTFTNAMRAPFRQLS